jgi:transcriptional/translational regulatory protein YebC/TACO1
MAFQGSLKELPLPDIIQLVSVSGKTGVFSLRRDGDATGEIFLRAGQIVHAHVGDLQGEEAVYELAMLPQTTVDIPAERINQVLRLMEALEDHDDVQKVWANFNIDENVLAAASR